MIVQSHWSKPTRWAAQSRSIADLLFMYASSAHSLRKAFRMPVGMVTDSEFAEMLRGLPMPYDFITTELDGWGMDPRWWASPKFYIFRTYAPQHRKMYQMDTDVFFWEATTVGEDVGLLVQSVEENEVFQHSYEKPVRFFNEKLLGRGMSPAELLPWKPDFKSAFNCGVVGFGNSGDAVEYATMAERICGWMTPHLDEFISTIPRESRQGSAMVIPEQYFLKCFQDDRNLKPAYVCSKMVSGKLEYYDPEDYYHAMAKKADPEIRGRFKEMVAREQPALHEAIVRRFDE